MVWAMKSGQLIKFLGVLVMLILSLASIRWLDRRSASNTPIKTLSPTASPSLVTGQVPTLTGSVAIQTFAGSSLVRTAAATVVASDGLIVTTSVAAPYGSGSYVYQVMTSSGDVVRAQRVAYDSATGLVLLKVQGAETGVVLFDTVSLRAGDEVRIIGATVALSRYTPVALPADIAYALDDRTVAVSVDRSYVPVLHGARVVDAQGHTVGIFRPGTTPGIISAAAVNALLERYLSSIPQR